MQVARTYWPGSHKNMQNMQIHKKICSDLTKNIGCFPTKSKTEAIFSPETLTAAKTLNKTNSTLPPYIPLPDNQHIQFTNIFKYLGFILNSELTKMLKQNPALGKQNP
jgi:hypothetical protein